MGRLIEDPYFRNKISIFHDRSDAGRHLAIRLEGHVPIDSIILAIPAGGVPVAYEMAKHLFLPLDLMIVRKVQLPDNTEAGFGAVGPEGEIFLNEKMLRNLGLTATIIERQVEKTKKVIEERNRTFRKGKPFPVLKGRPVILVDDGLASGYTMRAAVHYLRKTGVGTLIVAVPTAPLNTVNDLVPLVDEIYCLNIRSYYPFAVAEAYRSWYDVGDDEVIAILDKIPATYRSEN